jgi:hypothetical protein
MPTCVIPDSRAYVRSSTVSNSGRCKMSPSRIAGKPLERSKGLPLPMMLWLSESIYDGWKLNRPILLNIEQDEDGEYIATDSFSVVYGNGITSEKAAMDYCVSLVEYYEFIAKHADDNLRTALLFHNLRKYVSQIP